MRRYAKVSPRLWTGALGRRMRGRPEMQALAAYLVTSPHANMIGFYRLPLHYMVSDLGWSQEAVLGVLAELSEVGFCDYDQEHERMWVRAHARHEFPSGLHPKDNRVKGVENLLQDHDNSELVSEFLAEYGSHLSLSVAPKKQSKTRDRVPDKSAEVRLCLGCNEPLPSDARANSKYHGPDCAKAYKARKAETQSELHGASTKDVVAFYNRVTGRKSTVAAQGVPVRALLSSDVPPATIKLAILGGMMEAFLIGGNDNGSVYLDLETLLRKARYEGRADLARRADIRLVKGDVFQFWAQRWKVSVGEAMRRLFVARDEALSEEGGTPIGPVAMSPDIEPGTTWEEYVQPA